MKTTVESLVEQFRQHPKKFERNIKDLSELILLIDNEDDSSQSGFTVRDIKGFTALLMFALEKRNDHP